MDITDDNGESACACCGAREGLMTFSVPGYEADICEDAEACMARWDCYDDDGRTPGGDDFITKWYSPVDAFGG